MASARFAPDIFSRRRIPLAEIDAVVSARLGPTSGLGDSQPACFNRQVAMYLAKHVGRWTLRSLAASTIVVITRRFATAIQRIEALRESDPQVDALITDLKRQLTREDNAASTSIVDDEDCRPTGRSQADLEDLAELIAARVCAYI
jgi:hypothetical protein